MPYIDVTFEVVTPAYAGGADRAKTDGLRPSTLKSLLRFWWRAMHPNLIGTHLFDEEARIFGAPRYSNNNPCGQGISVVPRGCQYTPGTPTYGPHGHPPLFYMVYGADRYKPPGAITFVDRHRVEPGGTFSFRIVPSPAMSAADWLQVKHAVVLLSCFGGFGSRSRRGFGSLQVKDYQEDPAGGAYTGWGNGPSLPDLAGCNDLAQTVTALKAVLGALTTPGGYTGTPQHTAISSGLKVFAGELKDTWEEALCSAARVFHELRRIYGAQVPSPRRGADYALVNRYRAAMPASGSAPHGSAFGLPHNYQFRHGPNRKVSIEAYGTNAAGHPDPEKRARRASDVFFKVLAVGNRRRYCPVVLWLPSLFLPANLTTTFKRGNNLVALSAPTTTAIDQLFGGTATFVLNIPPAHRVTFQGYQARAGWQVVWP